MLRNALRKLSNALLQTNAERSSGSSEFHAPLPIENPGVPIGLIAGNSSFPVRFAEEARKNGRPVVAVAHRGETPPEIENVVDVLEWIKVGELGRLIEIFQQHGIKEIAMAGGINRVRLFGGVKLDSRGAALLYRLRSAKDDVIMRGIAGELEKEGMLVIPSTIFLTSCLVREGLLTKSGLSPEENEDVRIGIVALQAMGAQDIGQLVVVREGVVVAVEAVEGSDAAIRRGGELGGKGSVVVKCAKVTQDMRFDVPTAGTRTIQTMASVKARVLALESGRSLILDEAEVVALAEKHGISIVGCPPLLS